MDGGTLEGYSPWGPTKSEAVNTLLNSLLDSLQTSISIIEVLYVSFDFIMFICFFYDHNILALMFAHLSE